MQNDSGAPFFSLVIATIGRLHEVAELFESLAAQSFKDFEVIVVDQNADDCLAALVTTLADHMPRIVHLRHVARSVSQARNIGCELARGAFLLFPDDDCAYRPDALAAAAEVFRANPTLDFLCGPVMTPAGAMSSGRWATRSGPITIDNVWVRLIEFNFYVRRQIYEQVGCFDEDLGVPLRNGACEGPDLAIRMLRTGANGWFDLGIVALHPDKGATKIGAARAITYGRGMGRVLRKNRASTLTVLKFGVRPLGGVLVSAARRDRLAITYYWRTLVGRITGFLSPG